MTAQYELKVSFLDLKSSFKLNNTEECFYLFKQSVLLLLGVWLGRVGLSLFRSLMGLHIKPSEQKEKLHVFRTTTTTIIIKTYISTLFYVSSFLGDSTTSFLLLCSGQFESLGVGFFFVLVLFL